MTYTGKMLSADLRRELEQGYDVVRVSRRAHAVYQQYGRELSPQLDKVVLGLMAMEEGPEFEMTEEELRDLIERLQAM